MRSVPRPDWRLHERRCRPREVERLRSLTPQTAFAMYEDLARLAASVPADPEGSARLERARRREKLLIRRKLVAAFQALDRRRSGERERGERDPHDSG